MNEKWIVVNEETGRRAVPQTFPSQTEAEAAKGNLLQESKGTGKEETLAVKQILEG